MLKKSITYENPFTGQKKTEDFYFHISKADIVRMEVEEHKEAFSAKDGQSYTGMQAKLQRIVEAEDGKAMMPIFEDIIKRSYGRKDGDRFLRSEEIWADFRGSGAFDELLFELCTNAQSSAEFVSAAMPSNLEQIAAEIQAEAAAKKPAAKKRAAKKAVAGQGELKDSPAIAAVDKLEREAEIAQATTDNPVELTQTEVVEMEASDLQTGLASGKFKFPSTTAS